jgi:hypothetical protein
VEGKIPDRKRWQTPQRKHLRPFAGQRERHDFADGTAQLTDKKSISLSDNI